MSDRPLRAPAMIWPATGILPHETREALPAVGVMAATAAPAVAGVALTARRARAAR